jgi:hypothetical protein
MNVMFNRSTDGGVTWLLQPRQLNSVADRDQFAPTVATTVRRDVSPLQSLVRVVWLDRRLDPNNLAYHVYVDTSLDQGVTWQGNARLSDQPSPLPQLCPSSDCVFDSCYFQDYIDAAGMNPSTTAYFVEGWGDNRLTTSGQPCRVGTRANCPNIPIPSSDYDPDIRTAVGC